MTQQVVLTALDSLQKRGRIVYDSATNEVCIRKWVSYNGNKSPQFFTAIRKSLESVKNKQLIGFLYGIDGACMGYMTEQNSYVSVIVQDSIKDSVIVLEEPLKEQALKSLREDKVFRDFSLSDTKLYETLINFLDMREKLRKPMTDNAKELLCKRLKNLRERGQDIVGCIEQSIISGWTDVYEMKPDFQRNRQKTESAEEIIERRANASGQKIGGGY